MCILVEYFYINTGHGESEVGSLAGAAHLLHDNTGVLRGAQGDQKSPVEQKGRSSFDWEAQYLSQL
jgi:hypothetical protein